MMTPSTVGAALALLPQSDFAITGRGASLSNKFNATVSTIPLIWTALAENDPGRQSWANLDRTPMLTSDPKNQPDFL
jgi:hypothetical protein